MVGVENENVFVLNIKQKKLEKICKNNTSAYRSYKN